MKQFEIVTEPIQTEQYREFTINEHQGVSSCIYRTCKRMD